METNVSVWAGLALLDSRTDIGRVVFRPKHNARVGGANRNRRRAA
jgi:hypothetical protein